VQTFARFEVTGRLWGGGDVAHVYRVAFKHFGKLLDDTGNMTCASLHKWITANSGDFEYLDDWRFTLKVDSGWGSEEQEEKFYELMGQSAV